MKTAKSQSDFFVGVSVFDDFKSQFMILLQPVNKSPSSCLIVDENREKDAILL